MIFIFGFCLGFFASRKINAYLLQRKIERDEQQRIQDDIYHQECCDAKEQIRTAEYQAYCDENNLSY